jgi:predicted nucleic acid-binding protein
VILVDSSVWIDHLRAHDGALARLLEDGDVVTHAFVIGELALGNLQRRVTILRYLSLLPLLPAAGDGEVQHLINMHKLAGTGIGYVDAHLLASLRLTVETKLWTRDKRLSEVAARLGVAHTPAGGGVAEAPAHFIRAPRVQENTVARRRR